MTPLESSLVMLLSTVAVIYGIGFLLLIVIPGIYNRRQRRKRRGIWGLY